MAAIMTNCGHVYLTVPRGDHTRLDPSERLERKRTNALCVSVHVAVLVVIFLHVALAHAIGAITSNLMHNLNINI